MSAIGGKADIAPASQNVRLRPKADIGRTFNRTHTGLSHRGFRPLRCLVLSLGEGNETARQSRRQSNKTATPQEVEAPQCAKGRAAPRLLRCRP